ncbi:hypothetical protein [Brevibacterium oceani]|uniref:hypothetical protein n=1 Tax=Brevibacterium oceani TaxID=358099 RepID=UPI001B342948|nr:hypothetical protein [Brevibacterium oceani]
MTWDFQVTIADVVHRVIGPSGEHAWGVDHRGFDEARCPSLPIAEVELPTGSRSLLIVPSFPGGLVLDAVRTYQGLTDAELCTLFLGIVSALRDVESAADRLTLSAFALDAEGRPVLIPGVSAPLPTSPRRALGEMLYHAGCGRAWAECLMPVNLALAESSPGLRSVVGELLADMSPEATPTSGAGLAAALDEVAEAMRMLARPAALPLVPADRSSDPEAALTARLRVAAGHPPTRRTHERHTHEGPFHEAPAHEADTAAASAPSGPTDGTATPGGSDPAVTLRAASRGERRRESSRRQHRREGGGRNARTRFGRKRRGRRAGGGGAPRSRGGKSPRTADGMSGRLVRLSRQLAEVRERIGSLRGALTGRWLIAGAVCLTVFGGLIVWGSRPGAEAMNDVPNAVQGSEGPNGGRASTGAVAPENTAAEETEESADDSTPSDPEAIRTLKELCSARAEALSDGDVEALRLLTVPGSAAAAADELIDEAAFAGQDYTIEVEDITVEASAAEKIVARAQMRSSAGTGEDAQRFDARSVEFELRLVDGHWRVAEVTET